MEQFTVNLTKTYTKVQPENVIHKCRSGYVRVKNVRLYQEIPASDCINGTFQLAK
ncbi:MAG: hypothetical protein MJZ29_07285 [Bacteroidaceae bacterium]|nr:hypothetical protein [Bacteroidaceae bacterium]